MFNKTLVLLLLVVLMMLSIETVAGYALEESDAGFERDRILVELTQAPIVGPIIEHTPYLKYIFGALVPFGL
ncbi:hypothetical protein K7432_006483 [Basidiobolus ranarum]|uniref:Uncharacterized protein n=1 Tax=Basidiobolus ranarum TaxID=34480 RepID=A0ABR2W1P7_9FUNG